MADKSALISQDDLRPILKFMGRNWYFLLFLPLLGYLVAWGYTYTQPNVYAAKTEILLKQSDTYDYQSNIYSNLGYYNLVQDVINQKRVLKSHDIISEVLDRINFRIDHFQKGGIAKRYVDNYIHIEVLVEDEEVGNVPQGVYSVKVLDDKSYELTFSMNGDEVIETREFGKTYFKPYEIKLNKRMTESQNWTENAKEHIYEFQIMPKSALIQRYKSALSLSNEDYTSILSLVVRDNLNSRAKIFLDTLSSVYMDYTLETQVAVNENTQRYIEIQLRKLEKTLDSLEFEIQRFKEGKEILDLTKEQTEAFNTLTELEQEKRQLGLRISSLEGLENYSISDVSKTELPPLLLSNEDQILQGQVNKLFDLKVERVKMLSSSTENNSEIKNLDTLINIVVQNIQVYVSNTVTSLQQYVKKIDRDIRRIEGKLKDIPLSQQEIVGIERKFKVNEDLYKYLLEKKASSVIARAAIIPQVSVIESARSIGVVGPNRARIKTIALGAGLILALLIGFIRLLFFDRIENLQEFKEITKLPVVGSVPSYANIGEKPLAIEDDLRSNVSESLRALRANLQYILISDKSTKKILTSSLHPGEGKTFISTNLSSFIAHTNKKVVVVDFDMHKPKVHKIFKMDNKVGLSSYLIGKKPMNEIVRPTSVKNLDVITAGPIPPNASDLILNDMVEKLIAELEEVYDYIFIDTPPLMLISDSLVLMKQVDIGLFVFNTEKASKQGIQYLESLLEQNGLNKVSLILNNVKHKRWLYYYGKYAYKYSYKYGSYGYSYSYSADKD